MVLCTTTVVGATLGEAVTVEDSIITDPSEVTTDDCTTVVVEGAVVLALELVGTTEETTLSTLLITPPVERLTCLFSCFAIAASIS